jgi:hypothetical protein
MHTFLRQEKEMRPHFFYFLALTFGSIGSITSSYASLVTMDCTSSIVRTNDSKISTRLYLDFLQNDFSAGADHFVDNGVAPRGMAPQNKSRKFDYFSSSHANKKNIPYTLKWSRFTLKEHESPVNEGHTVFNMRSDGVGGPSNVF